MYKVGNAAVILLIYTSAALSFGQSESASKPLCKMSDPDVHLTSDGWSGPNCISSKDGSTPTHKSDQSARRGSKPDCKMSDPDVHLTADGWSGPDCKTTKNGMSDASAAGDSDGDKKSCLKTAGSKQANKLASQCLQISSATHPPCNVQNACSLIKDEIRRGCSQETTNAPAFCDDYK